MKAQLTKVSTQGLIKRDRAITAAALAALCILAWAYLLSGAGLGGGAREMTTLAFFPHRAVPALGMAMAPALTRWDPGIWALTVAMWWTMMVAMMTPSATPAILLYARVHRHAVARGPVTGLAPAWAFAAGYLFVWLGFSASAAVLYWALERTGLISAATMGSQSRWLSAGVLASAGLYQLSPLQNVCLRHCRSPAAFMSRHWRPGALGAVRLGTLHGLYCLGCCWMLMGLLFVGGVMNLAWIAALTVLVMAEKMAPGGARVARLSGLGMLAWFAATLLA